jgi:hypothetical protein
MSKILIYIILCAKNIKLVNNYDKDVNIGKEVTSKL